MQLHQMDVVSTPLNGKADEYISVEFSDGVQGIDRAKNICKLLKALYALKVPRTWNIKIDDFLKSIGFEASLVEPCS